MSLFKKAAAFLSAVCMAAAFTGCSDTTYGLVADDYTVPAGIYIYYVNNAYNAAVSEVREQNAELDVNDKKAVETAVKSAQIEGMPATAWIKDEATKYCANFVAIEKKFDELGLSMDTVTEGYLDSMVQYYWSTYHDTMEDNGISEESFRKVMAFSYKRDMIFEYYYGIDGEMGVTEDELQQYYKDNTIRCQYVKFDLLDEEGNLLKSDGKADVMKVVKEYQKRAEAALKDDGIAGIMAEMDVIQDEYTASKKASDDTAPTDAPTEEPTTEPVTEDGTTVEEETMGSTEAETEAETEEEVPAYVNERTIKVIHEEDYEDPSAINYSPSEKVYKALINAKDDGKPFIVEEDEAYYLAVRYDIAERMNEDDLWTESQIFSTASEIYGEDFDAMMEEWANALNVVRNDAAYKRYDPFKYMLDM